MRPADHVPRRRPGRRLRTSRPWPRAARTANGIAAAASLVLLVSACGANNPSSTTSEASAPHSTPLAYSRCMRANGVPRYPDPSSNNELPNGLTKVSVQQLGVSSSQVQVAERACAHLLPNGGRTTPAASAQLLSKMVRFSQCVRSHGVANWPDPILGPDGSPGFNLVGIDGIPDQSSPQFQNAIHECGHLVPHALGGIRVRSQ